MAVATMNLIHSPLKASYEAPVASGYILTTTMETFAAGPLSTHCRLGGRSQ